MSRIVLLCALVTLAEGFSLQAGVRRPLVVSQGVTMAGPVMPWDKKAKETAAPASKGKRGGGNFFDDEYDSRGQKNWEPNVVENGEVDLAAVGGEYYLALVPFLAFCFAYANGIFSFGYSNGNF